MKNTFGKTKGEYIRKVIIAGQDTYMLDCSSEQGKLIEEILKKIEKKEPVAISKIYES